MKRFEKIIVLLLTVFLISVFSACGDNGSGEYTALQNFEYHFYPEEYEEEYNRVEKSFALDADTDYQVQVLASCESGTMEISVSFGNNEDNYYVVDSSSPCNETIVVPANTTGRVSFIITIQPDTEGSVTGELLSR